MVRSSTKSIGAASAPARSSRARSAPSFMLSRPVVWKSRPSVLWMVATEITCSLVRVVRTSLPSMIFTSGTRSM